MSDNLTVAYKAQILHFTADPGNQLNSESEDLPDGAEYYQNGILIVRDGKVMAMGNADTLQSEMQQWSVDKVVDESGSLIVPGFIDTHIHYPQTDMIAAYGEQLLDWLKQYTFPKEREFSDFSYSKEVSSFFLDELLRNGTTSALIFGTVHKSSVEALFEEAEKRHMRVIAGKVLMDRNAPDFLLDNPQKGYDESKALIDKWHNKPNTRLLYAVTPRFAPTSTPEQLTKAGELFQEYADQGVYMHTHLSENKDEVEWVKSLFPDRSGYLDVYDSFELTGPRAVFTHSIHLTADEVATMAKTDSSISFCPTSNLFLGSGLFPLEKMRKNGIRVGLGTDVGAGTSFSMLQTFNEAYKVMQMQKKKFSAFQAFYLATMGSAKALRLDDKIGNLAAGKEADFVVLDMKTDKNPRGLNRLLQRRLSFAKTLHEKLFVLMTIGDDRAVKATYVSGQKAFERPNSL